MSLEVILWIHVTSTHMKLNGCMKYNCGMFELQLRPHSVRYLGLVKKMTVCTCRRACFTQIGAHHHIAVHTIGGSGGGGGCQVHAPPMGPNSFIFTSIFTEKHCIGGPRPPLTGACPPYGKSWIRHCIHTKQYNIILR